MALIIQTTLALAALNIILLLSLFALYLRNFLKFKTFFTLAFILFASLFLIHNVLYLYFSLTMMPYFAPGLEGYVFFFTLLQFIAFGILTFVSWKY